MESGTSLCLIVCFLICSSEAQKIITTKPGQDVMLPCKVPKNILITAVEWIRPHQDPEYVLYYRDGDFVPHNQHESYQNRVDLQDKEMKDGDVSMILKNVMMEDTGRYGCRVFEEGKKEPISIISLVVHPPAQTNMEAENIPAELGQDVILPCKVPNNNNIRAVEWSRPDMDPEYVLFYRDGYFVPENQHPSYQNRVDLNEEKMKDGDFSLVLKNVMKNDTGRYKCWVLQMEPHRSKRSNLDHEPISTTYLEVRPPGVKDGGNMVGFTGGHLGVVGVILLHIVVSIVFPGD